MEGYRSKRDGQTLEGEERVNLKQRDTYTHQNSTNQNESFSFSSAFSLGPPALSVISDDSGLPGGPLRGLHTAALRPPFSEKSGGGN